VRVVAHVKGTHRAVSSHATDSEHEHLVAQLRSRLAERNLEHLGQALTVERIRLRARIFGPGAQRSETRVRHLIDVAARAVARTEARHVRLRREQRDAEFLDFERQHRRCVDLRVSTSARARGK
jgi:hypothetical protein